MSKSDNKITPEDKMWRNLTKEYIPIEEKIAIIREHNSRISDARWNDLLESLKDHLRKETKNEIRVRILTRL